MKLTDLVEEKSDDTRKKQVEKELLRQSYATLRAGDAEE